MIIVSWPCVSGSPPILRERHGYQPAAGASCLHPAAGQGADRRRRDRDASQAPVDPPLVDSLAHGFETAGKACLNPPASQKDFRGVVRWQGVEPLVERPPPRLVLVDLNPHMVTYRLPF